MSTPLNPKGYVAGVAEYRYPGAGDEPAPRGAHCLILTRLGICVRGTWGPDALAWAPFPKRNKEKEALLEANRTTTR